MASEHHGKASRVTQFQGIEENVSYPLCCDRCLGPSNLLRMTKEVAAKKCNVCSKPFTLFSWKVAADQSRPKSTIICRACAESRGKCQSCLGQLPAASKSKNDDATLPVSGSRRNRDGDVVDSKQQEQQQSGTTSNASKNNIVSASITSNGGLSFLQNLQEQQQQQQQDQQQRSKPGTEKSKDNNKKTDSTATTKKTGFSFDWMHSS